MANPAEMRQYAGYRGHRKNRWSGDYNVVVRSADQGLDGGKWTVICEKHAYILATNTLDQAFSAASYPDWCEICQRAMTPDDSNILSDPRFDKKGDLIPCLTVQ